MRKFISILGLLLLVSWIFHSCGKEPRFIGIKTQKSWAYKTVCCYLI